MGGNVLLYHRDVPLQRNDDVYLNCRGQISSKIRGQSAKTSYEFIDLGFKSLYKIQCPSLGHVVSELF